MAGACLAGRELLRAFEHHVLDPVGDAGESGGFVAAADAVSEPPTDDGRAVRLFEQDGEPVGERVLGEVHFVLSDLV